MANKKTILDFIEDYNLELKPIGELYRTFCPFHDDTGKPNFTVWPKTNSWFCFACNEGGDAIKFVSKMDGISYQDAKQKVNGVVIDMDELNETIEGIGIEGDPISLNDELNILLSKIMRKFLYEHPAKTTEVLKYMKQIDNKLLIPVDYNKMQKILEETKQTLKNFV